MDKGFPKFQYSIFLKNGRDEQLVIRADTFEELMEAKKDINKILEKVEEKADVPEGWFKENKKSCSVDHSTLTVLEVKKEGINKGRHFTSCKQCNEFKWVS